MRRTALCLTAVISLALLAAGSLDASPINYVLQSGSTITPYYGATPTGPTEAMTGGFTWQLTDSSHFQATALQFQSPSFTLTLNTTMPQNISTIDTGNSTKLRQEPCVRPKSLRRAGTRQPRAGAHGHCSVAGMALRPAVTPLGSGN